MKIKENPKNSYAMAKAVVTHGGAAKLKIYPNVGHRGIILAITERFSSLGATLEDTLSFFTA